jgi:hypothetical protein
MFHAIPRGNFARGDQENQHEGGSIGLRLYNFSVGCARLVLQEELVFEQGEVWRNPKISLTEMDKNGNLKNTDRVQMNHSIW